jgi:hypothetical protein
MVRPRSFGATVKKSKSGGHNSPLFNSFNDGLSVCSFSYSVHHPPLSKMLEFVMDKRFAPPRDIARIFSIGTAKAYQACREGYVGFHKLGNRR